MNYLYYIELLIFCYFALTFLYSTIMDEEFEPLFEAGIEKKKVINEATDAERVYYTLLAIKKI